MWHQWFNCNFMKPWEYFLCTKKTKIMTLFINFFSSVSAFNAHSQEYYDACVWCCWRRSRRSGVEPGCTVPSLQTEECTCMCRGTLANAHRNRKRRNRWIFLLFFAHKMYSRSFITLRVNHGCHMDYFNNVLTNFLGLERGCCVAVYAGLESSRISSKKS